MTPMDTATTVNTKAKDPTIIKTVLMGKFPMSPDNVMEDEDPIRNNSKLNVFHQIQLSFISLNIFSKTIFI